MTAILYESIVTQILTLCLQEAAHFVLDLVRGSVRENSRADAVGEEADVQVTQQLLLQLKTGRFLQPVGN